MTTRVWGAWQLRCAVAVLRVRLGCCARLFFLAG